MILNSDKLNANNFREDQNDENQNCIGSQVISKNAIDKKELDTKEANSKTNNHKNILNKNNQNAQDSNKKPIKKIKYSTYGMIRKYGVKHELSFGVIQFLRHNYFEALGQNNQISNNNMSDISKQKMILKSENTKDDNQGNYHALHNLQDYRDQVQIIAVSKKAGIAVTRNKIKRRLKHIFRDIVKQNNHEKDNEIQGNKSISTYKNISFIIRIYKDISKIPFQQLYEQIKEIYKTIDNIDNAGIDIKEI